MGGLWSGCLGAALENGGHVQGSASELRMFFAGPLVIFILYTVG